MDKPNWSTSPADPSLRRAFLLKPSYDCGFLGEKCQHEPKGDHGQDCAKWFYVVGDGKHALDLAVNTGTSPRGTYAAPKGDYVHFHGPTAYDEEEIKSGSAGSECEFIETGRCFGTYSYGEAGLLFAAHGAPQAEQSEVFWLALEQLFIQHRGQYLESVAEAPHRCPACGGKGLLQLPIALYLDPKAVESGRKIDAEIERLERERRALTAGENPGK